MREQLGNHTFLDSGLLRTFDQLEQDEIGVPNTAWIEDYFFDTDGLTPADQIADWAVELATQPHRDRPKAWQTAPFASQHELITYRRQITRGQLLLLVIGCAPPGSCPMGLAARRSLAAQVKARRIYAKPSLMKTDLTGRATSPAERQPSRIG